MRTMETVKTRKPQKCDDNMKRVLRSKSYMLHMAMTKNVYKHLLLHLCADKDTGIVSVINLW